MRTIQLITTFTILTSVSAFAKQGDFYLRPVFGLSQLNDTQGVSQNVLGSDGPLEVDLSNGFNAGLGFGYHYSDQFSVEAFWEYRSNDSEVNLTNGQVFTDGNYASNTFFLNGKYALYTSDDWHFYSGAGLGWVQEIDIDLEQGDIEYSYSGDGDIAWQVFAGFDYTINNQTSLTLELRHGQISGIDLDGEGVPGSITDLDYRPTTFEIGLKWRF